MPKVDKAVKEAQEETIAATPTRGGKAKADPAPKAEVTEEATVYVEQGWTQNMGNYNSAKLTVGVTLPVNPSKELLGDVKATVNVAITVVRERLDEELKNITAGL